MLELFFMISLSFCLSRLAAWIRLIKEKHVPWIVICIALVISISYGGDAIHEAVKTGFITGICANGVYLLGRLRAKTVNKKWV